MNALRPGIPVAVCVLTSVLLATPVAESAPAALVLRDGRVLEGIDVRREGDQFVLHVTAIERIPIPAPLVSELRLSGAAAEAEEGVESAAPHGLVDAEATTVAGAEPPEGPGGLRRGDPEVLVGERVQPPRIRDQLAVFGPPAEFSRDIVETRWRPRSDWDADLRGNEFAPASWAESIRDTEWRPRWSLGADVTKHREASWQESVVGTTWTPVDGFRRTRQG